MYKEETNMDTDDIILCENCGVYYSKDKCTITKEVVISGEVIDDLETICPLCKHKTTHFKY